MMTKKAKDFGWEEGSLSKVSKAASDSGWKLEWGSKGGRISVTAPDGKRKATIYPSVNPNSVKYEEGYSVINKGRQGSDEAFYKTLGSAIGALKRNFSKK